MSDQTHPVVRRFIEDAGNIAQDLGFGRLVGQIYALLYFSPTPCSLDDIKDVLGISKGGASVCVRQLETIGAVQRIWVKGDRRDYYIANDYFGKIMRRALEDLVGRRVESLGRFLDDAEQSLGAGSGNGDLSPEFLKAKIERLRTFQKKARKLMNSAIVRKLLQ